MKKQRPQLAVKKNKPPQNKLSKVTVHYQNRQQQINLKKEWQEMKSLITKKFQFCQKDSLQFMYEFQDDLIQIMIPKDYQTFCEIIKQNKQISLMVLKEMQIYVHQEVKEPIKKEQRKKEQNKKEQKKIPPNQFNLMDLGKSIFNSMFVLPTKSTDDKKKREDKKQNPQANPLYLIAGQFMKGMMNPENKQKNNKKENDMKKSKMKMSQSNQNQKMNNKKQKQDIIWLKCTLCKEKKRQNKYICILCQKVEQIYCYDCHEKRQNPKQHILKEMQMGNQRQIAFFRDCLEKQQKCLNKSQLKYYSQKDYLMKELKQIHASQKQNQKISQKEVQISIMLAKVFNDLGQLFKAKGQINIYRIYSEKSMLMINSLSTQEKISKDLQQISSQIRFIYYSSFFEGQQILNLKKLTLLQQNYQNLKSRRKVIKICNQISKSAGKAKSKTEYSDKIFDEIAELMKQMKTISAQSNQQIYSIIQNGVQFLKTLSRQANNNSELNFKNHQQSNFFIKFTSQLLTIVKFNSESQLGQFCDWIDIEDAIKNLTRYLQMFMRNKQKYLSQITKIFSILSIYQLQNQDQIKSEEYLQLSKKLMKQNLCQKNYIISDIKDIEAYIAFNRSWKLKNSKNLQLSKQLSEESLKMKISLWEKQHLSLCVPLNNLAIFYANQQKYNEAQIKLKQALQICQKNQSFDKKNLYVILTNLAYVCSLNGQKIKGKKYMEESLKIQKQIFQSNNCGYDQKQLIQGEQHIQNQDAGLWEMISTLASQKIFQFVIANMTIESHQRIALEAYMNS